MKNYPSNCCLFFLLLIFFSCSKKQDKIDPTSNKVDKIDTFEKLDIAVNKIYAILHALGLVGQDWYLLQSLRADENKQGATGLESSYWQLLNGNINENNEVALLPIPYEEMKINPNIESQNPGY